MDFNTWLAANSFDPETLSAQQRTTLTAAWRASQNPKPDDDRPGDDKSTFYQKVEALDKENARQEYVREVAFAAMEKHRGNSQKCRDIKDLMEAAIADQKITTEKFDLKLERLSRYSGGLPYQRDSARTNAKVIEAAFCRMAHLPNIEKHFDTATLEASEDQFKDGLSLVGLLHHSAVRNGWRGMPNPNSRDFLRAAFGQQSGGDGVYDIQAGTTGPSTFSLPNILGNIANKYLRAGFLGVENTWSRLASRRSVNNFQTVTGVGLNGKTIYRTLAPSGEIKHAELTETTYTNRASTYAIMVGIPREALVNDDVSAFSDLSRHVGRGAGLIINDRFWTAFLNNSAFFTSGNANVSTGAGSALGTADGAAINAAEQKFIAQTGADGYPIAVMPKIMLVPPTLANTARRWMGSFGMVQSGTAGLGDSNVFAGRYSVETSSYMENSSYTSYSTAAWYLLADPNDVPVIEGVALNGKWEPTVDTAEADFNQLGMAMRGYIDIGFSLYEYRGGVRSAGS